MVVHNGKYFVHYYLTQVCTICVLFRRVLIRQTMQMRLLYMKYWGESMDNLELTIRKMLMTSNQILLKHFFLITI